MKSLKEMEPFDWLIWFVVAMAITSVILFALKAASLIAISWWWIFAPPVVPIILVVLLLVAYADGMSR